MKTILLITALLTTGGLQAQAQLYGQLGTSYQFASDFDPELSWDYLIGYAYGPHALEVQSGIYGFEDTVDGQKLEFEMLPILINYAYGFETESRFQYEAGFGAGVAVSEFDIANPAGTDDVGEDAIFVGQVFGRALYPMNDHVAGVLEYRAMITGSVDEGEEEVEGQLIHGPTLSLRLSF